ncbi:fumarylacetoacetate hydrolase family protein [Cytobacillus sp. IB215665]|uniref:fumarylacetoacetate hydrolase family protein n=1 Tax=Cytobacillus sp. IB215665 TaxID=3097357 RepID=UPI002A139291|nr:fumarylacetoacetate hydrolase family protein [Cytobacillus sp. IB215665]MDX8365797.1 fumarylacetoacetate hydrolase family protein [Cytobacillus sp. IB215665]
MRFVTAKKADRLFVGTVNKEMTEVLDLNAAEQEAFADKLLPTTLLQCIQLGHKFEERVQQIAKWAKQNNNNVYNLNDVELLAPIPRPSKNVFCVGKNYADHAIEMGSVADIPTDVMMFSKTPTTVIGTNEIILNHRHITNQLDYEGELAVVIGKKGKGISEDEALDYVFGYTIVNDITARDLQARHKQFLLGKSLDTSCPMGPVIVHKSLVKEPNQLNIETRVNDEIRQSANTKQFIFSIEKIISVLSQGTTLEPGDIIATGTPAGVGKGFTPPKFLQPGDVVEVTVEGIGTLSNSIEE